VTRDGYRYQLIFGAQYDHADHIHFGAEWVGAGVPSGTVLGGSTSGGATTYTGASTGTSGAPVPSAREIARTAHGSHRLTQKQRQRLKARAKAKKMEGRQRSRLLRSLIAQGPEKAVAVPSLSTPERTKVTVEL
jgi:hypothetical protein